MPENHKRLRLPPKNRDISGEEMRQRYPELGCIEVSINEGPFGHFVLYLPDGVSLRLFLMSSVWRPKYHISPISLSVCAVKALARLGDFLTKWPQSLCIQEEGGKLVGSWDKFPPIGTDAISP